MALSMQVQNTISQQINEVMDNMKWVAYHIVRELRLVTFVFFRVYGNLPNISCIYTMHTILLLFHMLLINYSQTQCRRVGDATYIPG